MFFVIFFIKAYDVGTHLTCDAIQMGTRNICLYKEVDKKYTGCNLKTAELLVCALIGVCAVIRLNTDVFCEEITKFIGYTLLSETMKRAHNHFTAQMHVYLSLYCMCRKVTFSTVWRLIQ